jgi:Domain of unknown function (DUF5664)
MSEFPARYDLIPPEALEALARTYGEGAEKYAPHAWREVAAGDSRCMYSQVLNHLQVHIERWRGGDRSEDHLAHAAWGLMTLLAYEATGRTDLDDLWKPASKTDIIKQPLQPDEILDNDYEILDNDWCPLCQGPCLYDRD